MKCYVRPDRELSSYHVTGVALFYWQKLDNATGGPIEPGTHTTTRNYVDELLWYPGDHDHDDIWPDAVGLIALVGPDEDEEGQHWHWKWQHWETEWHEIVPADVIHKHRYRVLAIAKRTMIGHFRENSTGVVQYSVFQDTLRDGQVLYSKVVYENYESGRFPNEVFVTYGLEEEPPMNLDADGDRLDQPRELCMGWQIEGSKIVREVIETTWPDGSVSYRVENIGTREIAGIPDRIMPRIDVAPDEGGGLS